MQNRRVRVVINVALAAALSLSTAAAGFAQDNKAGTQLAQQAAALGVETPAAVAPAPRSEVGGTPTIAEVEALIAGPQTLKTSASCDYNGHKLTVPIVRWEKGVNIVKDENGQEIRQEYQYPIFKLPDYQAVGDYGLCYQVCHDACGNSICWPVCTWHCASQGGNGDPRKK